MLTELQNVGFSRGWNDVQTIDALKCTPDYSRHPETGLTHSSITSTNLISSQRYFKNYECCYETRLMVKANFTRKPKSSFKFLPILQVFKHL